MIISGLQNLTLLDYPTKVSCTVFTHGCNFRCPFCHNACLVTEETYPTISVEEVLSFLKKRVGVLDGICLTGGEPLLQSDVGEFLSSVKELGYAVKLDTNGSFPSKLKSLVKSGLIDYVAMDVKSDLADYSLIAGVEADASKISESIDFLLSGTVDYEFRTTIVKGYHDEDSVRALCERIRGAKRYFLQNFVDSGNLIGKAEGVDELTMRRLLEVAKEIIPTSALRGID